MTHTPDPPRHSREDVELRASFRRTEAAREARFRQLEERLAAHGEQVKAILQDAREQAAEPVVADPPPVFPPPVYTATSLPPGPADDLDQLAAASVLGGPAHLEWRRQHVPDNPYSL